jgi:hypothetical protein
MRALPRERSSKALFTLFLQVDEQYILFALPAKGFLQCLQVFGTRGAVYMLVIMNQK